MAPPQRRGSWSFISRNETDFRCKSLACRRGTHAGDLLEFVYLYRATSCKDFERSPTIVRLAKLVALSQAAENPEMNNPVLLVERLCASSSQKSRSEGGCPFFIQEALHVVQEVSPSSVGEILPTAGKIGGIALPEVDGLYSCFFAKATIVACS